MFGRSRLPPRHTQFTVSFGNNVSAVPARRETSQCLRIVANPATWLQRRSKPTSELEKVENVNHSVVNKRQAIETGTRTEKPEKSRKTILFDEKPTFLMLCHRWLQGSALQPNVFEAPPPRFPNRSSKYSGSRVRDRTRSSRTGLLAWVQAPLPVMETGQTKRFFPEYSGRQLSGTALAEWYSL